MSRGPTLHAAWLGLVISANWCPPEKLFVRRVSFRKFRNREDLVPVTKPTSAGILESSRKPTPRQVSIRRRLKGQDFQSAVLFAVHDLFQFTHRATDARALWSDARVVWLGRSTFLHWCLEDAEFDVPWLVRGTADAPRDVAELREQVRSQLTDYFAERLSKLPRRSTGNWLPLP